MRESNTSNDVDDLRKRCPVHYLGVCNLKNETIFSQTSSQTFKFYSKYLLRKLIFVTRFFNLIPDIT
jgi:hypothetical protein